MTKQILAFIGGTGAEGMGLAQRLSRAGYPARIGSRDAAHAEEAAAKLRAALPQADIRGGTNAEAAREAEIAVLVVPYAAQRETLEALKEPLNGKIVITAVNPLEFREGRPRASVVPEGSAAEQAQAILPDSRVVGAFNHLSARMLDGDGPLDCDCLVFGEDEEAKRTVMALVADIRGLRPVDAGGLNVAHAIEGFTAAVLGVNRANKTLGGVRITGLEKA